MFYLTGKTEEERKFQSLEANELAIVFVQLVPNLTVKRRCAFENCVFLTDKVLGSIIILNSSLYLIIIKQIGGIIK